MKLFCQWYVLIYVLLELCKWYSSNPGDITDKERFKVKLLGAADLLALAYSLYTAGAWSLLLL